MEHMNVEFVHVQKVFMEENVNVIQHHQQLNQKFNNVKSEEKKIFFFEVYGRVFIDQDHRIFVQEEDNVFVEDVNVKQQQLNRANVSMVITVNAMIFHVQEKMIMFVRVYKNRFKKFNLIFIYIFRT